MRGRTVRGALIYNGETKVSRPLVNIEMNHLFAHGKYPSKFSYLVGVITLTILKNHGQII